MPTPTAAPTSATATWRAQPPGCQGESPDSALVVSDAVSDPVSATSLVGLLVVAFADAELLLA